MANDQSSNYMQTGKETPTVMIPAPIVNIGDKVRCKEVGKNYNKPGKIVAIRFICREIDILKGSWKYSIRFDRNRVDDSEVGKFVDVSGESLYSIAKENLEKVIENLLPEEKPDPCGWTVKAGSEVAELDKESQHKHNITDCEN